MRRNPREPEDPAIRLTKAPASHPAGDIGIVLSGGGARAAYQVGALRALIPYFNQHNHHVSVLVGSSIGAVNIVVLASGLKHGFDHAIGQLEEMWRERTYRNSFSGHPSMAFLRSIKMAALQYLSPGPNPSAGALFDPTPLMNRVDGTVQQNGGTSPDARDPHLRSVAVMTTVEGTTRRPLLFVSTHKKLDEAVLYGASFDIHYVPELTAKHGFASAALPAVLPPIQLDTDHGRVTLVDGGISQNVPVDPAVRLGAEKVILVDISGRDWWLKRYHEPPDTRPKWEVPAGLSTFCLRPPDTFIVRNQQPLGPILKDIVGRKQTRFISAVGPTWPIYTLLRKKLGEDVAFETMTYVALDPEFLHAIIERGYDETRELLRNHVEPSFARNETITDLVKAI